MRKLGRNYLIRLLCTSLTDLSVQTEPKFDVLSHIFLIMRQRTARAVKRLLVYLNINCGWIFIMALDGSALI